MMIDEDRALYVLGKLILVLDYQNFNIFSNYYQFFFLNIEVKYYV